MSQPRVDTLEMPVVRRDERPDPAPQQWAAPAPRGPRRLPRRLLVTGLLVGAAVAGVAAGAQQAGIPVAVPAAAGEVAPVTPQSLESFDPSGGSGFAAGEDGWRTQTYTTAEFGDLKEGVGLLIDLGEPRALATVTLQDATGGLPVELRAADTPSGDVADFRVVASGETAAGATELQAPADAAEARYWLVWVTGLAPSGDGFAAEIGDVTLAALS